MKILSISSIPLLPHLGSGQTRLHWTQGLQKLGHTVDVLQPKDFELLAKMNKAKQFRMAIGILLKVNRLLRHTSYDLIEFYGSEYWLMLIWLKKFKKKRPLLVAHADGVELNDMDKAQLFWDKKKGIRKWVYRQTHYRFARLNFLLADRLVCGCFDDLEYMIANKYFSENNAVCIAPGVQDSFHSIPYQENKNDSISFVGSWIGRKGIDLIPPVINQVLKTNENFSFQIFGTGMQRESILKYFDASIQNRIEVFDRMPIKKMQEKLSRSSMFFMPTYSEGFGLSTVEAMSCSCAVITTPTGIGKEITNNKEAIICSFGDIKNMVSNIYFLINNVEKRKELAYNGWLRAKEYLWEKQVHKLETTYLHWYSNPA